ncbi:MAG: hypothetical protein D6790_21425 [Caldilineae bacterium]|nr:MAG: hypothetical protein D6790_21425 [Caldilineae bacterium]
MSTNGHALAARITRELRDTERLIARAEHLLQQAQRYGDMDILDGAALNLHGFYAAAERIFEDIAREVDGALPEGADWHRSLLLQMAAPVPRIRPAVISEETYRCLDEFRGFRHVVRNVYTFNLRPARVEELVKEIGPCFESLVRDMEAFAAFLVAADGEAEP